MARPWRIEFPGAIYHVTARGNARAPLYLDDADRHCVMALFADVIEHDNWLCHAFCLMDTPYHLVLETLDGHLSKGMCVWGMLFRRWGHIFGRIEAH